MNDMRTLKQIRADEAKKANRGTMNLNAKTTSVRPVSYCVDISTGLVMTRSEFLSYDRR